MPAFVELPTGIFTSDGVWFHTSRADLEEFAAPVLERVPLEKLLKDSAAWLRSPGTLALWVLLIGLLTRSWQVAVLAAFTAYAGWSLLAPGLVLRPLVRLASVLGFPLVVGGAFVACLSWLAADDALVKVAVGLLGFVFVRWGLLTRALQPVLDRVVRRMYALPESDQILRALIVRHALALGVSVGDLDAMEKRMMDIGTRHKRNKP
ncbi:MAG: hypothetical protein JJ896_08065 [Rhodothermales bacterium]|nr:hypothetical protein [Rhodothermales bacterium]MBO6779596.1 hypothetical protein [Rhodothermales bacterium]